MYTVRLQLTDVAGLWHQVGFLVTSHTPELCGIQTKTSLANLTYKNHLKSTADFQNKKETDFFFFFTQLFQLFWYLRPTCLKFHDFYVKGYHVASYFYGCWRAEITISVAGHGGVSAGCKYRLPQPGGKWGGTGTSFPLPRQSCI